MALKASTVVVHNLNDTAHAIDVTAESLYEASAQVLAALRGNEWVGDIGRGPTTITVKVRHPEVTHVVKIQDFENWLNRDATARGYGAERPAAPNGGPAAIITRNQMYSAAALRRELSVRGQQIATATGLVHELTLGEMPSVIFGRDENRRHGNLHPASYRNICANPQWSRRLRKVHTASRKPSSATGQRWMELDCANSSDALLMNIFCHGRTVASRGLSSMLGIAPGLAPEFGFRPGLPLRSGRSDRTEIDMKLGHVLVEAKPTETDFQKAPARMIERYRDIDEVFAFRELRKSGDVVFGYQLIRGVLAAHATSGSFCVLCDARRPDLIEDWYSVMRSVRICALRCRLQLMTWQELASVLPRPLQKFIATKYGIATG